MPGDISRKLFTMYFLAHSWAIN